MADITNKINNHLDNIETIKGNVKKDIENLFKKLNVGNLVNDPGNIVDVLPFVITEKIIKKYVKPIFKESQRYVKNVIKPES